MHPTAVLLLLATGLPAQTLVKDINTQPPSRSEGSNPTWLATVGSSVYFAADDGHTGK